MSGVPVGLDHERIREEHDRSATDALLTTFQHPEAIEGDWRSAARTLMWLEDPRADDRLIAMLEDRTYPAERRALAGKILRSGYFTADADRLRSWWQTGDIELQRHALRCMKPDMSAIVESVAADPRHPLYRDAITTLAQFFDMPRFQVLKVQALRHEDPAVRCEAAWALLWDEPVIAERPLIDALLDPDPRIAVQVADTLQYYPSQRAWKALWNLGASRDDELGAKARESATVISGDFLGRLTCSDDRTRDYLRQWLQPIWEPLEFEEEEVVPDPPSPSSPPPTSPVLSANEILDLIESPSFGRTSDIMHSLNWGTFVGDEREQLRRRLPSHPDPFVRDVACTALSAWGDQDELLNLASDPSAVVRKSAMYCLGETSPLSSRIAMFARERLTDLSTAGWHSIETLRVYVRSADPIESTPWLESIARDRERSSGLRTAAVQHIVELNRADVLVSLLPLLLEPPPVHWGFTIELLRGSSTFGLAPPGVDGLLQIDNVDVQKAIAPFVA